MADAQRELEQLAAVGYCVVRDVIPPDRIAALREHVVRARQAAQSEYASTGGSLTFQRTADGRPGTNVVAYVPEFAAYLADERVLAIAHGALDPRVRIAQIEFKFRPAGDDDAAWRYWHTDWPHDLSAYGAGDPLQNVGCVRQPFPDLTMCLVMIWYLTDVDAESGGTWVVPGSHRDTRNPRGPRDGISIVAPIPGELQVSAPAGSVYIQDSRSWHASAMHNTRHARVAVVNRWAPWWLSVDDFAPGDTYNANMVCRPLSQAEYRALPAALQPLMRHLCPDEHDTLQQPVLDRAAAAGECARKARERAREDPGSVAHANAHIRVRIAPADS